MGYFLSLEIPDHIVKPLDRFELPPDDRLHIQRREDLHITLAYIGHMSDHKCEELIEKLNKIDQEDFQLKVSGAHYFGPGPGYRNHFFTAAVDLNKGLEMLKDKVDAACLDIGFTPKRHDEKYRPHITLARADAKLDQRAIDDFIARNQAVEIPCFDADHFSLYKSQHPKPYKKICDFSLRVEK